MSHDLIAVADLEARTGTSYAGATLAKAEAFIADASALVRLIAEKDFHDPESGAEEALPAALVPILVSMVRRGLDVPAAAAAGLTGEQIGSYGWQSNSGAAAGPSASIYATRREQGLIRKAAGVSPVTSIGIVSEFDQYEDPDEAVVI